MSELARITAHYFGVLLDRAGMSASIPDMRAELESAAEADSVRVVEGPNVDTFAIDVPNTWRARFDQFDAAEKLLRERWAGDGVSPITISQTFAAFGGVKSAWKDPAFRVWAALRGCVGAADFFTRWKGESDDDDEAAAAGDGDEARA